jgi:hypothetical protein
MSTVETFQLGAFYQTPWGEVLKFKGWEDIAGRVTFDFQQPGPLVSRFYDWQIDEFKLVDDAAVIEEWYKRDDAINAGISEFYRTSPQLNHD